MKLIKKFMSKICDYIVKLHNEKGNGGKSAFQISKLNNRLEEDGYKE